VTELSNKKNFGRFCIQFHTDDPRHLQVIELLEKQGRRKAHFIAEAVLRNINGSEPINTGPSPDVLRNMVEAIVKECLGTERLPAQEQHQPDNNPVPERNQCEAERLDADTAAETIDPDLRATIKNSIAAFRNAK
jgi:hypothetical protein